MFTESEIEQINVDNMLKVAATINKTIEANNARMLKEFLEMLHKKMAAIDQSHIDKLAMIESLHAIETATMKDQLAAMQAPRSCLKSTRICEAANCTIMIPND